MRYQAAPLAPYSRRFVTCFQDGKTRCTTGSVVSSLYHLKDSENDNRDAGFFVFPDLSVRQEGSYRLKLSLFEVVGCVPTHHLSSSLSLHIHPSPPMCLLSLSCFTFVTNPISLTPTSAVPFRFSRFVPFRSVPLGVLFSFHCVLFFIPCPVPLLNDTKVNDLFQIERVSLQIHLLRPLLCVYREEVSGDGRFGTSYFLMTTPLTHDC